MKKAYIVLAHRAPEQLARLVGSLDDGQSDFFIHLDRSCDREPFRQALAQRTCWQFVQGENGAWGQIGIVKATLHGLRAVAAFGQRFDSVNLISGQDYPLRSNAYFDRFFELNRGKIFIEWWSFPAAHWTFSNSGFDRIYNYHVGDRRRRSRQRVSRWITRIANATLLLKRRFPRGLKPYGGWQWWSLPMDAVDEILRFVKLRPDYLRYHRWSLLPDEMFFQTILLNSDSESIRNRIVNNCLRFIDWDNPNPAAPATLTEEYFGALISSRSLFARKFDPDRDRIVLDLLDEYRLEEERRVGGRPVDSDAVTDFSRSADYPSSPASHGTKMGLLTKV